MTIRTQFFWRLYLNYVLTVLLVTGLISGLLIRQVSRHELDDINSRLQTQAEQTAMIVDDSLRLMNFPQLRSQVDTLAQTSDMRYTIIDPRGVVMADSREDPYQMNNHLQRPEVLDALTQGRGSSTRFSQTLQENFTYYAVPILYQGQRLGFSRVALSLDQIDSQIQTRKLDILRYGCLVAFVGLMGAYYLAFRMALPVSRMTSVAEGISSGDYDRRLPVDNGAGLGKLSRAINELARSSAQRVSEITSDRNRLSAIFAGMVEGVIDVDQGQRIIHINDAAASLLGVNPKSCLKKPIWQEIRIQEINSALDEAIRARDVVKTQMRLSRESDELVVDIYAASLSTSSGEPIGAVIVLNDITELENLERVRTDFVANASHELKTPITAIRGLAETLLGDDEVDLETVKHFVERIHLQSLRLSQLISDLMAISRLESADNKHEMAAINMTEVAKRAVQAATVAVETKQQKLLAQIPEQKIMTHGDNQNLSQLVDNLIDNAIKYTPEKGEIRVALSLEGNQVHFVVEDTGLGISPQYQQRVFERFYRVDKARSLSLGGTGLGLSIVKNIAEKHGGTVRLESQLGRGSRFTVTLPAEI